jgi:hypothetical protein
MKYYPKSQVKTGLYTKGKEFYISSSQQYYIGKYWGASDGRFYTGDYPGDNLTKEIIPVAEIDPTSLLPVQTSSLSDSDFNSYYIYNQDYFTAKNLSSNLSAPSPSKTSIPVPTSVDYMTGYITRYFVKKNNETKFIEISYIDYVKYVSKSSNVPLEMYTPFSLKWYISGDINYVVSTNKINTYNIENQLQYYGFYNYIDKFDFLYK